MLGSSYTIHPSRRENLQDRELECRFDRSGGTVWVQFEMAEYGQRGYSAKSGVTLFLNGLSQAELLSLADQLDELAERVEDYAAEREL